MWSTCVQPLHCDLQCGNDPGVAKHNSIYNSSTSKTCSHICSAGTILELQNAIHLQLIHQQDLQSHLQCGNDPGVAKHKSIYNSSTSNTCSHICSAATILELQNTSPSTTHPPARLAVTFAVRQRSWSCKTQSTTHPPARLAVTFAVRERSWSCKTQVHLQLIHQQDLQSHLQCGNDPGVAKHNGNPSTTHPPARLAVTFAVRERSWSCKTQFHLQLIHQQDLQSHLQCRNDPGVAHTPKTAETSSYNGETIRDRSEHDARPSGTRRSAELDRRGSETHFVHPLSLKNAFRARLPPKVYVPPLWCAKRSNSARLPPRTQLVTLLIPLLHVTLLYIHSTTCSSSRNDSTTCYSSLHHSTACYSTLHHSTTCYSTLLYVTLLHVTLLYIPLLHVTLLCITLLFVTLLFSIFLNVRNTEVSLLNFLW